eukprot:6915891-Pyramimonas_sp.AAC.1
MSYFAVVDALHSTCTAFLGMFSGAPSQFWNCSLRAGRSLSALHKAFLSSFARAPGSFDAFICS